MEKEISQLLKEIRLRKQLTQKELSEKMGIARAIIAIYERGEHSPTVDQLEKYAKAFDMELCIEFVDVVNSKSD